MYPKSSKITLWKLVSSPLAPFPLVSPDQLQSMHHPYSEREHPTSGEFSDMLTQNSFTLSASSCALLPPILRKPVGTPRLKHPEQHWLWHITASPGRGVLKCRLLGPTPSVSDSKGLNGARECAALSSSQVVLRLVDQRPHWRTSATQC